jgi:hypothetical protein
MNKAERNKLDRLLSQTAREIWTECRICGREGKLDPHHVIGRTHRLLRWALCNIVVCCFRCHRKMHDNPLWTVDVLSELFGYEHLDTLRVLGEITGVKRSYEEAAEQMTWGIEAYMEKYL